MVITKTKYMTWVYNAVGRATEAGTNNPYQLVHSTASSGWSIGMLQWDYGARGGISQLLTQYSAWTNTNDPSFLNRVTQALQSRGNSSSLTAEDKQKLNLFFSSNTGINYVASLDESIMTEKWNSIGSKLVDTSTIQALTNNEAMIVVSQISKIYNQNQI